MAGVGWGLEAGGQGSWVRQAASRGQEAPFSEHLCVDTGETLYKPHHPAPPKWEPRLTLSLPELTRLPGAEGDSRPCLGVQEL